MEERLILEQLEKFKTKSIKAIENGYAEAVFPMTYELFCQILVQDKEDRLKDIFDTLVTLTEKLPIGTNPKMNQEKADKKLNPQSIEEKIYRLYCECWLKLSDETFFDETAKILREKISRNNIDMEQFQGKKALDMGCGSGRYTVALKSLGFKEVIGVDLGEDGLNAAKEKVNKKGISDVHFQRASVLELPFSEETFDFVFCNGVLHHTTDTDKGLREIHRVLKKDGLAWVYVYNSDGLCWKVRKVIRKILEHIPRAEGFEMLEKMNIPPNRIFLFMDSGYVDIENNYLKSEFEEKLKAAGFKRIQFLPRGSDHIASEAVYTKKPQAKALYGEYGDLRFLVGK